MDKIVEDSRINITVFNFCSASAATSETHCPLILNANVGARLTYHSNAKYSIGSS